MWKKILTKMVNKKTKGVCKGSTATQHKGYTLYSIYGKW